MLAWAAERFAPRVAFATGFGAEGCVLIDLIARHRLPIDVFTLDTGVLFPETYALWRRLEARYGLTIRAVRPAQTVRRAGRGATATRSGQRDPDRCCKLRKVEPLRQALAGFDAWITAIRRDQTPERAAAAASSSGTSASASSRSTRSRRGRTRRCGATCAPTTSPSTRCTTRATRASAASPARAPCAAGEDPRAGRWRGREKTECGLHADARGAVVHLALARRPEGA